MLNGLTRNGFKINENQFSWIEIGSDDIGIYIHLACYLTNVKIGTKPSQGNTHVKSTLGWNSTEVKKSYKKTFWQH